MRPDCKDGEGALCWWKTETGGYDFRYVYGLDKLQVRTTSEGSDWWGQTIHRCVNMDYVHTDRVGSVVNLSDQFGRVAARADYTAWGEIRAYTSITVDQGFRVLLPEVTFAGHEWDDVLGKYYAKARMYDQDAKRFDAVDPVKGNVIDPMSLVQYLYVKDNPLRYIDPLGLELTFRLGTKDIQTKTMNGVEYAPISDLIAAYGGAFEYLGGSTYTAKVKGPETGINITLSLNNSKGTLNFSTDKKSETIYRSGTQYAKGVPAIHLMEMHNDSNYVNISYFQHLMCQMGYTLSLTRSNNTVTSLESAYKLMRQYLDGTIDDGTMLQNAIDYVAINGRQTQIGQFKQTSQFYGNVRQAELDTEVLAWTNYWNYVISSNPTDSRGNSIYEKQLEIRANVVKAMLMQETSYARGTKSNSKNSTRDSMTSLFPGDPTLWILADLDPSASGKTHNNLVWVKDSPEYGGWKEADVYKSNSWSTGAGGEADRYGYGVGGFGILEKVIKQGGEKAPNEYYIDYTQVTNRMSIALALAKLAADINRGGSEAAGVARYGPSGYINSINKQLDDIGASHLKN